jgi:hypothetical protein
MFDLGKTTEDPTHHRRTANHNATDGPASPHGWTSAGAGGTTDVSSMGDTDSIEGEDGALAPAVGGIAIDSLAQIDEQPIQLIAPRTAGAGGVEVDVDFVDERRLHSDPPPAARSAALPQPLAISSMWGTPHANAPQSASTVAAVSGAGMSTNDALIARLNADLKARDDAIRFKEQTIQQLASNLLKAQLDARHTQQSFEAVNKELHTEVEVLKRQLQHLSAIGTPDRAL